MLVGTWGDGPFFAPHMGLVEPQEGGCRARGPPPLGRVPACPAELSLWGGRGAHQQRTRERGGRKLCVGRGREEHQHVQQHLPCHIVGRRRGDGAELSVGTLP